MAKTEAQFLAAYERQKAANLRQRAAYAAARAALNGKSAAMQTINGAIDVSRGQMSALVPRAEALVSSAGNTGGTPPTSTNASLALLKSAILAAPTTYASIPAGNSITVIQGAPNELPVYPGGAAPVLHYFAPPANSGWQAPAGLPDILTVAKLAAPETFSDAFNGDSSWLQSNGQNRIVRKWAQEIGAHVAGFTTNGRYFSLNTRFASENIWVMIDGVLQPTITVNANDCWTTIDMGSRGTRNIVTNCGQNEFGGIATPNGDTITPYDHLAGKIRYNTLRDSWGQRRDYAGRNFRAPDIFAKLIGAHSVGGYVKGGTGYLQNVSDADDDQRRIDMRAGSPHLVDLRMMVNDNDPAQNAALQPRVRKVYQYIKADSPNAVFMVVAQTSKGSSATTVGGETRKRDLFKAEWDLITGPKIFIDCLVGTWYADAGAGAGVKTRATALGPMITGEGSEASPTGSGNADVMVDNNDGRHLTSTGVPYSEEFDAKLLREALAVM